MEEEREVAVGSCSKPCGQLEEYIIPDYILKPDAQQVLVDHAPPCPIVVFINSRSGGQLGSSLIKTYRELLNEAQVVLSLWKCLGMENLGGVSNLRFVVRAASFFSGL
jgi:diacylglycerol kinase (ATP)